MIQHTYPLLAVARVRVSLIFQDRAEFVFDATVFRFIDIELDSVKKQTASKKADTKTAGL